MRLVFPGSKPVPKRHPPNMPHGKKVCVLFPWGDPWHELGQPGERGSAVSSARDQRHPEPATSRLASPHVKGGVGRLVPRSRSCPARTDFCDQCQGGGWLLSSVPVAAGMPPGSHPVNSSCKSDCTKQRVTDCRASISGSTTFLGSPASCPRKSALSVVGRHLLGSSDNRGQGSLHLRLGPFSGTSTERRGYAVTMELLLLQHASSRGTAPGLILGTRLAAKELLQGPLTQRSWAKGRTAALPQSRRTPKRMKTESAPGDVRWGTDMRP